VLELALQVQLLQEGARKLLQAAIENEIIEYIEERSCSAGRLHCYIDDFLNFFYVLWIADDFRHRQRKAREVCIVRVSPDSFGHVIVASQDDWDNKAARRKGVTGAFLATVIISAFAGIVLQSQLQVGQSSVGREYLLPAFTAGTGGALHALNRAT
jgi:hypothetical protein